MEHTFSQRMGLTTAKTVIQINSMDDDLRKGLWNAIIEVIQDFLLTPIEEPGDYNKSFHAMLFTRAIWVKFFKNTVDTYPQINSESSVKSYFRKIKEYFFKFEWYEVYDFLEFLANRCPNKTYTKMFIKECNSALERELSAYRFNGKILVPFTSELELSEIKEASNTSKLYAQHLDQALNLLSDRKAPDYRNSIKESISAVEAMCQLITGNKKAILEDALRQLETKLPSVHPALRDAFRKIYAYSGDADGIRHALKDEPNLGIEDAKFMLVACSAFINFLLAKADRTGIKLSQQLVVQ